MESFVTVRRQEQELKHRLRAIGLIKQEIDRFRVAILSIRVGEDHFQLVNHHTSQRRIIPVIDEP